MLCCEYGLMHSALLLPKNKRTKMNTGDDDDWTWDDQLEEEEKN